MYHIRDRRVVRDAHRLNAIPLKTSDAGHRSTRALTFGFPVVPLEKLRNASFVRASPGASRRSTKRGGCASPSATSSSTVGWEVREGGESARGAKRTMRSGERPTACAAASATAWLQGCTMRSFVFVAASWCSSSPAVYDGLAALQEGARRKSPVAARMWRRSSRDDCTQSMDGPVGEGGVSMKIRRRRIAWEIPDCNGVVYLGGASA